MNAQRTPVLDLAHDPERLAAIVAAPWERPADGEAVIVTGTLPGGRTVYGRYSRAVVDGTRPVAPALAPVTTAPERPRAAPSPFVGLPADMQTTISAAIARTPAPTPAPRPQLERPTAPAARADVDRLLALTPLGQDVLRAREDAARTAAARVPPPISAGVRRGLEATHLGRQVLADRKQRDPAGEAASAGLDPARRRELLSGSHLGRAQLADEARAAGRR